MQNSAPTTISRFAVPARFAWTDFLAFFNFRLSPTLQIKPLGR